jgi:hypothetical protein
MKISGVHVTHRGFPFALYLLPVHKSIVHVILCVFSSSCVRNSKISRKFVNPLQKTQQKAK